MNRDRLFSALWGTILGYLLALGGVCGLSTAFSMDADLTAVALWLAIGAAAGAFLVLKWLFALPLGAAAVAVGYLWRKGLLMGSFRELIFHISLYYDAGYGWGTPVWSFPEKPAGMEIALIVAGTIIAWITLLTVVKGLSAAVAIFPGCLPTALCLVVTDTVPDTLYLALVLAVLLYLMLTQGVRRRDPRQGNRLTAMLCIPIAAAVAALLLLMPRESYDGQAGAQQIEDFVRDVLGLEESQKPEVNISVVTDIDAPRVELKDVGPQSAGLSTVLRVTAQEDHTLYLRSCAYDTYNGTGWSVSASDWALEQDFATSTGEVMIVQVRTLAVQDTLFFTYAPTQSLNLSHGRIENTDGKDRYSVFYAHPTPYHSRWNNILGGVTAEQMEQYLQLPDSTIAPARRLLRQNVGEFVHLTTAGEIYTFAQSVASYVRSSATYDLRTGKMPPEETDFALWFLEESDTGYCVHYATAATVLLRAAGIPARYVTGYLVKAQKGEDVSVKTKDAHAWVEYYVNGLGWMALEPTASGGRSPIPESTASEPPLPSVSTEPEPTTEETTTGAAEETTEATQRPTTPSVTKPSVTTPAAPSQPEPTPKGLSGSLLALSILLLLVAQSRIRVYLRLRRRRKGRANDRALKLWQELSLHGRLLKRPPEEELLELAQKARFSQHTLNAEELHKLERALTQSLRQLKNRSLVHQLLYTLVLALY